MIGQLTVSRTLARLLPNQCSEVLSRGNYVPMFCGITTEQNSTSTVAAICRSDSEAYQYRIVEYRFILPFVSLVVTDANGFIVNTKREVVQPQSCTL